jgi:hypothetical protein
MDDDDEKSALKSQVKRDSRAINQTGERNVRNRNEAVEWIINH